MRMYDEKKIKEKLNVFQKLIILGFDTDKKILDMKIEELILTDDITRKELNIAVGIKQALSNKTLVSFISGL